jgi:hypothetical protein
LRIETPELGEKLALSPCPLEQRTSRVHIQSVSFSAHHQTPRAVPSSAVAAP